MESESDVNLLQRTVYQNEKESLENIMDQVVELMCQLVNGKLAQQKKKKNFYKNFKRIGNYCDSSQLQADKDYENLERITQKYEQEIRSHISLEQQLKLYADSIQSQMEDAQKLSQKEYDKMAVPILKRSLIAVARNSCSSSPSRTRTYRPSSSPRTTTRLQNSL